MENKSYRRAYEGCLKRVQKPARYIGNEFGSVHKDWEPILKDSENTENSEMMSFAFCFPDVYEVGMSHLGMKILYHMLNEREDTVCERVFAPWDDMEQEMRRGGIPLLSMESYVPVRNFDIVGFTLQYEMSYSNVVNMLDLAGIPLRTRERGLQDPFVCCGGPCAYHAEPLADLVDFFILGEGEEVNNEIMDVYKNWRVSGRDRDSFLEEIVALGGVYVPKFYDVEYNEDGTISRFEPNRPGVPKQVKKRIIMDLDNTYIPEKLIVPFMETVHDRIMLEVFRGCIRGCRFCQAGYIYRPVRERSVDRLVGVADCAIRSTGYEEMSLSSLSTSDYTQLQPLIDKLLDITVDKKINLSLPSLRVDNFSMELMEKVQKVKKSGLTFAPEAGTQRLRDVINKNVREEELIRTANIAFRGGYNRIKLYFMLGLPTETYDDVLGIAELGKKVIDESFFSIPPEERKGRSVSITISTSFFVPKPFTPFQWEPQNRISEMEDKARFLKENIKSKKIVYNWHNSDISLLEAVFAKGDRRLGEVLITAQKMGCKFDGWSDFFDFDRWLEAFRVCGIDPEFYALRRIGYDEILPWDYADIGVPKSFLIKEHKKAYEEATTPSCREKCSGCGAASFGGGVCFE